MCYLYESSLHQPTPLNRVRRLRSDLQDVKLGTGALGTADCKRTSELLSGSLQVKSVGVGLGLKEGCCFFFGGGGKAEKKGGGCLDGGGVWAVFFGVELVALGGMEMEEWGW